MSIKSVKGFRDFYPEQMAAHNYVCDAWRRVSRRNGFAEYGGPILEYLDLFRVKSGEEIVGQLFSLTDRGGRELAIRPEITPTLARMVNAKIHSLPRPVKWFSMPRLCRAENPQKGRGREFYQWNVDVLGSDEAIADAECIFTLIDLLAEVGLSPAEVTVSLSSRSLIAAALAAVGVPAESREAMLPILDKRSKLAPEAFEQMCVGVGLTAEQIERVGRFQDATTLKDALARAGGGEAVAAECEKLAEVMRILSAMGADPYCRLDLHVVRGLAYYTGVVYEVSDAAGSLRALAGGGRYDNLLEVLGGPRVGATGFGMGDMVLGILLAELGKLPDLGERCDNFVIDADGALFDVVLGIVAELRRAGLSAGFSYKRQGLGKQIKTANRHRAGRAIIVGDEWTRSQQLVVKDLASGEQQEVPHAELVGRLRGQGSDGTPQRAL